MESETSCLIPEHCHCQLHFHAEKLKYYQKCHMLYLVRHVLLLNKVGWGPHLGKVRIIVIVCSVLCLLSCLTDLFGQLFLFSSLNELLPFLSINMFTHLNLRKIRLPIENIEMYIVNKNV